MSGHASRTPEEIDDAPRFAFRGLMLDLGRNFHPKTQILAVIEQMAAVRSKIA